MWKRFGHILIPVLIFIGTFLIYKSIYPDPRNWYDHYVHLAKSIIEGRVDVPTLPEFYQDKIEIGDKIYLPFPPGASFVLIPFMLLIKNVTQQQVSVLIGAVNIALFYILLSKFTNKKNAILLSLFVGFGTSYFWASVVGTTWFFAHIVAINFLLLSLICYYKKSNFLSGLFLALAGLTRIPVVLAGIFYLLKLWKNKKRLFLFLLGASLFIPIFFYYNWARFGSIFETGYYQVYLNYVNSSYPFTIRQLVNSNSSYFAYLDIKNIPLHLYSLFFMPPNKSFQPSPYGMGIMFTSPLLLFAFWPNLKNRLQRNFFIAAIFSSIPSMLHYMQGWVQFGYRFLLDYLVFLMLILAIKFKPTKFSLALLAISIVVNFWGVRWAINLGW